MLLAESVPVFLAERERKGSGFGTISGYWSQLRLLMDWLSAHGVEHVGGVTGLLLETYIAEMKLREGLQHGGKLSPVTIRKRVMFLRQFFGWTAQQGMTQDNPALAVEIPKAGRRLAKIVPRNEIARLLDSARWHVNGLEIRDAALLRLMFDSGLRLAELCDLNVEDLDLAACIVHVRAGKWDQERFSVFTHDTAQLLAVWLETRVVPEGVDAFFTSIEGARLTTDGMYKVVKRRAKESGVKVKISPHRARHSFVTYSLEAGAKLEVMQQLAGHNDPKTTAGYNWLTLGKAQREHEDFSPLRGLPK